MVKRIILAKGKLQVFPNCSGIGYMYNRIYIDYPYNEFSDYSMDKELFGKFYQQNHKDVRLILEIKEDKKIQERKEDDADIMD